MFEFDGLNRFAAELPAVLSAPGPVFATLKIVAHSEPVRREFKAAIRPLIARRAAGG